MVFGIQSMKRRGVEINRKRKVKRCTSLASPKNVQHQTRRTLFLRPSVWYKRSVSRTEKKFGRKAQNPACVRVRTIRNRKSFISHMIPFIIPNRRFLSLHARTQVFGIFSRIFSILLHAGKWDGVPPTGRAVELRAHRARDGAGGVLNSPLSGLLRIVTNQPSSVLTSFGHLPP